jgi:hypothetical protein
VIYSIFYHTNQLSLISNQMRCEDIDQTAEGVCFALSPAWEAVASISYLNSSLPPHTTSSTRPPLTRFRRRQRFAALLHLVLTPSATRRRHALGEPPPCARRAAEHAELHRERCVGRPLQDMYLGLRFPVQ